MEINFSSDELHFIKKFYQTNNLSLPIIENKINIDSNLMDEIRDWVLEQQQIIGFDEQYQLTREGEILEGIADKLYR